MTIEQSNTTETIKNHSHQHSFRLEIFIITTLVNQNRDFVHSGFCLLRILSNSRFCPIWDFVHPGLRPIRDFLHSGFCPFLEFVHSRFCPFGIFFNSGFVYSGFCPIRYILLRHFVNFEILLSVNANSSTTYLHQG